MILKYMIYKYYVENYYRVTKLKFTGRAMCDKPYVSGVQLASVYLRMIYKNNLTITISHAIRYKLVFTF